MPLVLNTPRSQLPDAVAWLEDWRLGLCLSAVQASTAAITIAHVNTLCLLSTRAGLFSSARACAHDETSLDADVAVRVRTLKLLVARAHANQRASSQRQIVQSAAEDLALPPPSAPQAAQQG